MNVSQLLIHFGLAAGMILAVVLVVSGVATVVVPFMPERSDSTNDGPHEISFLPARGAQLDQRLVRAKALHPSSRPRTSASTPPVQLAIVTPLFGDRVTPVPPTDAGHPRPPASKVA